MNKIQIELLEHLESFEKGKRVKVQYTYDLIESGFHRRIVIEKSGHWGELRIYGLGLGRWFACKDTDKGEVALGGYVSVNILSAIAESLDLDLHKAIELIQAKEKASSIIDVNDAYITFDNYKHIKVINASAFEAM